MNPASSTYAHWMISTIEETKKALATTQEKMAKYTNKHRTESPAYQIGDLVMLSGRTIKTRRPSRKLDHKYHGPFQVEKVISPSAVRLTLTYKWKKHPTFHVSEIKPFKAGSRPAPDPTKVLREAADIENDDEYDVDGIKGSITCRSCVLYHVKWRGNPKKKDWTFEPYENFTDNGRMMLLDFHTRYPEMPRDYGLKAPIADEQPVVAVCGGWSAARIPQR